MVRNNLYSHYQDVNIGSCPVIMCLGCQGPSSNIDFPDVLVPKCLMSVNKCQIVAVHCFLHLLRCIPNNKIFRNKVQTHSYINNMQNYTWCAEMVILMALPSGPRDPVYIVRLGSHNNPSFCNCSL